MNTNPKNITVREGLDRYRKDISKLVELASSIVGKGQLQPIIVNSRMELIDGGRRLAACIMAEIDVEFTINDELDSLKMREIEFEANHQRESSTPAEEAIAIQDIHTRRCAASGRAVQGSPGSGWTIKGTALLLGLSSGTVCTKLKIAEAVEQFPELRDCKTDEDILKIHKGIVKVANRAKALKNFTDNYTGLSDSIGRIIFHARSEDFLRVIPDQSVDIIITDPPYMLEIGSLSLGIGGVTGGYNTSGFKYDDAKDLGIYTNLAKESTRICKDTSHAFVFISIDYFPLIRNLFIQAGWDVAPRPIIWCKPGGSCNQPKMWLIPSYEVILFARRSKALLEVEGCRDLIQGINPVQDRQHPAEKPVELFRTLLKCVALPGKVMIDPFMGSGASLVAGIREKLHVSGCDILSEAVNVAREKVLKELINETDCANL